MLLASAYLLLMNYTNYWGIFFGFTFIISVGLILADIFIIPVFREKFFSAAGTRKENEAISEDTSVLVMKRANYKCQSCGAAGNKIYHMDRVKSHNDPNNLLCLCDKCLSKVERGLISGDQIYIMRMHEKHDRQKRV